MYKLSIRYLAILMLFAVMGCDQSADTVEDSMHAEHSDADLDMPELPAYIGPVIDFRVTPEESATQFNWSVVLPNSGWKVKLDGISTNRRTGHATIKLQLTKPGPDALVNFLLRTGTDEYRHETQSFKTADLIVKLVIGDESGDLVQYKRAASWRAKD